MINQADFGELMLLPQAVRLYRNKYLRALRHSFFAAMPFLLAVSVLDIVNSIAISPTSPLMNGEGLNLGFWLTGGLTGEAYRQNELIKLLDSFKTVVKIGYGTVSLIIAAELSGRLSGMWNVPRETAIVTTLITFFLLSPFSVDEQGAVMFFLSGRSFFSAFFSAFAATWLLSRLSAVKRLQIEPPDYLTEGLAERLIHFFPILATLAIVILGVLVLTFLRPLLDILLGKLGDVSMFQSLPVALFYEFIVWGLWWLGIPGFNFTAVIHDAIFAHAVLDNQINDSMLIFTEGFFTAGIVHILGLIISIIVFSRHRAWRRAATLGLPFMLFNVEELFVFGLPIVLNPVFVIPFLIAPLANTIVGWAAISWGIVPAFQIFVPASVPPIINAVLGTHSIMGGVLQVVWLIMDIFIYAPFVITANMFMLSDEAKGGENS